MSDIGTHQNCGGQIRETGQHDLFPFFCERCGFQFSSLAHAENETERFEHLVWRIDEYSGTYYSCCVPASDAHLYEKF